MAKRLAYLGPAGTFSEEAAVQYDPNAEMEPHASIPAVALAVASGMADEGVVPIENSLEGSVTFTLDTLIQEDRLLIRRELVLPIEHCLIVKPGTTPGEIQAIYSHPQALAQCRSFLERCFPKAQQIASLSTAAAVDDARESSEISAAIAPRRAAELQEMEILGEGVQDSSTNVTRFVVLAHSDHPRTGRDKTSLCFSFQEDKPGALYNALGVFAHRDINLTKVESRPSKQSLGDYIFLIDMHGHREDPVIAAAIETVRIHTSMLKVFGSYPRWDT